MIQVDYELENKLGDYYREKIFPKIRDLTNCKYGALLDFLFDLYNIRDLKKNPEFRIIPVPYFYDVDKILDKYSDKCVFFGRNDQNTSLSIIYQKNKDFHFEANLAVFNIDRKVEGHFQLFAAYKKFDDYLNFIEEIKSFRKDGEISSNSGFGFSLK